MDTGQSNWACSQMLVDTGQANRNSSEVLVDTGQANRDSSETKKVMRSAELENSPAEMDSGEDEIIDYTDTKTGQKEVEQDAQEDNGQIMMKSLKYLTDVVQDHQNHIQTKIDNTQADICSGQLKPQASQVKTGRRDCSQARMDNDDQQLDSSPPNVKADHTKLDTGQEKMDQTLDIMEISNSMPKKIGNDQVSNTAQTEICSDQGSDTDLSKMDTAQGKMETCQGKGAGHAKVGCVQAKNAFQVEVSNGQTMNTGQGKVDAGQWKVNSGQGSVDPDQIMIYTGQGKVDTGQGQTDTGQDKLDTRPNKTDTEQQAGLEINQSKVDSSDTIMEIPICKAVEKADKCGPDDVKSFPTATSKWHNYALASLWHLITLLLPMYGLQKTSCNFFTVLVDKKPPTPTKFRGGVFCFSVCIVDTLYA